MQDADRKSKSEALVLWAGALAILALLAWAVFLPVRIVAAAFVMIAMGLVAYSLLALFGVALLAVKASKD